MRDHKLPTDGMEFAPIYQQIKRKIQSNLD